MFIKSSASKFTGGISCLWRGMDILNINKFIISIFQLKKKKNLNYLLYESARSAILHSLECLNITNKDQVIKLSDVELNLPKEVVEARNYQYNLV